MSTKPSRNGSCAILWFRLDLRLADNLALQAAIQHGGAVIPVFIHAPDEEAPWQPGAASRWWLHQSLKALDADLRSAGSRLVIREGRSLSVLQQLVRTMGARAVFWNRRYEPVVLARDASIETALLAKGLLVKSFNGSLLNEPWTIQNQSRKPFQVFTPFWKYCLTKPSPPEPLQSPLQIQAPHKWPNSVTLTALRLQPKVNWAAGIRAAWQPGIAGAANQLDRFLNEALESYSEDRNRPDLPGTSRLSPHLHFGELSPRQIWHRVRRYAAQRNIPENEWRGWSFITELGWREFSHHLLYHFPHTPEQPLRAQFSVFRWHKDRKLLKAWQKGLTGYPIVDAGMRELWTTGWMHNRVRMIVGSFLVKDLLISWTEGARWFWDTLVDADLAQNTLGWQWTAGCGADAAPYFRVFNPVSQGEKFDPHGQYVRRWCPELRRLPDKWVHKPWQAPSEILSSTGVRLGHDYPGPIVNHIIAREVALEAFTKIKSAGREDARESSARQRVAQSRHES
jgi:deoxyribodipyrimidine photo-lyase